MNKFIQQELKKCKVAKIPAYDGTTTQMVIAKEQQDTTSGELAVNEYYIVELANYILNPPPGFTLASNWNKGVTPKSSHLKCMITQVMGKMIKLDGCGYDTLTGNDLPDVYMGLWLPLQSIKIIQKIS